MGNKVMKKVQLGIGTMIILNMLLFVFVIYTTFWGSGSNSVIIISLALIVFISIIVGIAFIKQIRKVILESIAEMEELEQHSKETKDEIAVTLDQLTNHNQDLENQTEEYRETLRKYQTKSKKSRHSFEGMIAKLSDSSSSISDIYSSIENINLIIDNLAENSEVVKNETVKVNDQIKKTIELIT